VSARNEAELSRLLDEVNKDLVSQERLRMLVVVCEPWTIENGQPTPTTRSSHEHRGLCGRAGRWLVSAARQRAMGLTRGLLYSGRARQPSAA
jgi:hypothetical protein